MSMRSTAEQDGSSDARSPRPLTVNTPPPSSGLSNNQSDTQNSGAGEDTTSTNDSLSDSVNNNSKGLGNNASNYNSMS